MADTEIKAVLLQLHGAIKHADGPAIAQALGDIEALLEANRATLHPQLVHFLEGRSYAKALAYLGGADALGVKPASPPGGCGGHL